MTRETSCQKCVALWREYQSATREHVALLKEQEHVAGVETLRFVELEPLIELAAAKRDAARFGIRVHLAAEHYDAPHVMTA